MNLTGRARRPKRGPRPAIAKLPVRLLFLENDPGGGTVTGTRSYSIGGNSVATRTGSTSVSYLAGDQQDTDSVAISAADLAVTRRYYDPYGNPRGTAALPTCASCGPERQQRRDDGPTKKTGNAENVAYWVETHLADVLPVPGYRLQI